MNPLLDSIPHALTRFPLSSPCPPIKTNLEKVLPLVEDAIKEKPELDNEAAAEKLHKDKKISLFERLLFVAFDSEANIGSFKSELGI